MGRLERLELENFKSYGGKQVVGPFADFTCVIGPNGAGKSNLMDAISFVLGIGARQLRGSALKDLVYRKDASSAPARRAAVTLVYRNDDGAEMLFGRSIAASGASSYRLNDRETTFEAFEATLQTIGVLVKARNFLVFQGDVESVASKSPQELTRLLEHISGSEQSAAEYEQLLGRKEAAEEKALFALQKRKMYHTQRKEVKEQRDEAELFGERRARLATLRTRHLLWRVYRIRADAEDDEQAIAASGAELGLAVAQEEALRGAQEAAKKELAKANRALGAGEKEQAALGRERAALGPRTSDAKAKARSAGKRLAELERARVRVGADINEQRAAVRALEEEAGSLDAQEAALRTELSGAGLSGLVLSPEQTAEYGRLREEAGARTAELRAQEVLLEMELRSKQRASEACAEEGAALAADEALAAQQLGDADERAHKLGQALEAGRAEAAALLARAAELRAGEQRREAAAAALGAELAEVSARLQEAGDDRRRGKQEQRAAEAVESMRRVFPGVRGRLVDLCRPIQKRYSTAVAVAAGRNMDALVVDSAETARDCIRYLRDQRVGAMAFLPLDSILAPQVPERLRGTSEQWRLCVDLVECADEVRPAVRYAVGATVVCETLEDARELCFARDERVKAVTLAGQVISRAGAMTGGALGERGGRWEEREVEALRARRAALEEELRGAGEGARAELLACEAALRAADARARYAQADLDASAKRRKQLAQQQALKGRAAQEAGAARAVCAAELAAAEQRLEAVRAQCAAVDRAIFGSFCASVGVANIREYEEGRFAAHQQQVRRLGEVSEKHASVRAQLAYEKQRDFSAAKKRLEEEAGAVAAELAEHSTEIARLEAQAAELDAQAGAGDERCRELKERRRAEAEAVKRAGAALAEGVGRAEGLRRRVSSAELLLERHRAHLHDVLQTARLEEVSLPCTRAPAEPTQSDSSAASQSDMSLRWEGSTVELDADGSRVSSESTHFSQRENAVVARDARYVALVDLSLIRSAVAGKGKRPLTLQQQAEATEGVAREAAELQRELDEMQPNMHAVERFEAVSEKLREVSADLEAAKEEAASLAAAFERVKRERLGKFNECFKHVCSSLAVVYRDLTKSTKHPLGGNAYLTLDDNDEPYLGGLRYTAMPPMKRFRDMDQLSGGEKTIAALALLFSIHSYRQAPFFVLDEVDAALDNVNVKKVCNYIKQRSADFQCIVISLKDIFFEHADSLVGICKDVELMSSKILTLDLNRFAGDSAEV